jgi:hypothetical protein
MYDEWTLLRAYRPTSTEHTTDAISEKYFDYTFLKVLRRVLLAGIAQSV